VQEQDLSEPRVGPFAIRVLEFGRQRVARSDRRTCSLHLLQAAIEGAA